MDYSTSIPHLREYAPELMKYAKERIKKHENPMQMDCTKFLENDTKADPTNRIKPNIAIRLLPFFESFPMVGVRVLFE